MKERLALAALVLSVLSCGVPLGQAALPGDSLTATQVPAAITPSPGPEAVPGEIAAAPALTGLRMLDESNG